MSSIKSGGNRSRTIMLIDVNSAFLSWEAAYRSYYGSAGSEPDLRDIPSIVGGDAKKRRGIVLAKSVPAKKYGIRTGDTVKDAMNMCPCLTVVPPNHELYSKASAAFVSFLQEITPSVEQYSVDECFIDITGVKGLDADPVKTGDWIRHEIFSRFGYTVNVGISTNKLLAKMASELKKPDMTHTLYPEEIEDKMWPLPIEELFMSGPSTSFQLKQLGIKTIGDLACAGKDYLIRHFKPSRGTMLYNYANGIDESPVHPYEHLPKSIGNSSTIPYDISDEKSAHLLILSLCEMVGKRLREHGMQAGAIGIMIKDSHFRHYLKSEKLPYCTQCTQTIYGFSKDLFGKLWNGCPIRAIGVYTSELIKDGNKQLTFIHEEDKFNRIDPVIDRLRKEYGNNIIMRGGFVDSGMRCVKGGTGDTQFFPHMHSAL